MAEKTDAELEAVYKAGFDHSHAGALRTIYQLGRTDEAEVHHEHRQHHAQAVTNLQEERDTALEIGQKRAVKHPGEPQPVAPEASKVAPMAVKMAPKPSSKPSKPSKPLKSKKPKARTNIPNTPAPGHDPPGGSHPSSNA